MKTIIKIIITIIIIISILVIHISIRKFSPFPFNYLNTIFLAAISLIIFTNDFKILFQLLVPTFLLELFSSTPFGLNTAALILSLSILSWFLINIFTNYSMYMVGLAGLIGMISYRLLFILFLLGTRIFFNFNFSLTKEALLEWLWEIILTVIFVVILYLIISSFSGRFKPHYVAIKKS